jgi:hypothetical protein
MVRELLRLLLCCMLMAVPAYGGVSPDDDAMSAVAVAIAKILPEHVKALVPGADKEKKWISITWDVPFVAHHSMLNDKP